ncbi:galactose-binding domain-like protein, partial [Armillaria fumosa]
PRGVRGFQLNDGTFTDWKVQGKVGGYTNYPDKVRGIFNEGGLFGERAGWHLPGFDTSSWEYRDLSNGLPNTAAGVGFFVTTFELDIPAGYDVPISFVFDEPLGQLYRVYLFVNGWMMGKRVGNLGYVHLFRARIRTLIKIVCRPQSKFPVQEGILDYHGEN